MTPFRTLRGIAVPVDGANIDTDQIIPARFLLRRRTPDYGRYLFHDLRFDTAEQGRGFVLDRPDYRGAVILVADANFGCGSAREQAPWAIQAFGIGAIVASGFGDIFYANCLKNGLLPAVVEPDVAARARALLADHPGSAMTVDLDRRTIVLPDETSVSFAVDEAHRRRLLDGKDELSLTLADAAAIDAYEAKRRVELDWT
ncbi:MAG: 3-isopropylmalate dehydratase small subunit [Alphaproteobacteria bacterium]|nr:3-isopropylmalate dehydratase small subunit [Alphaproteobacteria bacterium]